jgi:hypothetical protein
METTKFEQNFEVISKVTIDKLVDIQERTNMEDMYFSDALSKSMASVIQGAISLIEVEHRNELSNKEYQLKEQETKRTLLIKDQQEISEKIKNGGVSYAYTYNIDGTIATKTLVNGTVKSIYELEMETEKARATGFRDNLRIKRAEHLGNTIFGLGAGGLKPNASLWGQYFASLNDITAQTSTSLSTSANTVATGIDVG